MDNLLPAIVPTSCPVALIRRAVIPVIRIKNPGFPTACVCGRHLGFPGPTLESAGKGRRFREAGQIENLVDGLLGARQQAPGQTLPVTGQQLFEAGPGLLKLRPQRPRLAANPRSQRIQGRIALLQQAAQLPLQGEQEILACQIGHLLQGQFFMNRQQLRLRRRRGPVQQGSGEHQRPLFCPQNHRTPVNTFVKGPTGAFGMFKLDMLWLEVGLGDMAQEAQNNAGRTFQIMTNRMTEPGQDCPLALHPQLKLHGVGHQPAVTQCPLQALAEGGATEKQILENLPRHAGSIPPMRSPISGSPLTISAASQKRC